MAQILDLGKLRFNWSGDYNPLTEYTYNDIVKYGPNVYVWVSQTSGIGVAPNPPTTTQWKLAIEGVSYRGEYASSTLYYKNDIVIDGTNTYIVLNQHTSTSNVANPNANLQIIALGQEGLPNQTGNADYILSTDGVDAFWTSILKLDKAYIGNDNGSAAETYESTAALSDAIAVLEGNANSFVQTSVVNLNDGDAASTDIIAYTAQGTNDDGWIDMGITSANFDDETFGITGPNDGYIFMSAPRGAVAQITNKGIQGGVATITTLLPHGYTNGEVIKIEHVDSTLDGFRTITTVPSANTFTFSIVASPYLPVEVSPFGKAYKPAGQGNLVFATDQTGLSNKIVFAAGGYVSGTTQMEIIPDTTVHIDISTQSTSASTGALTVAGGAGFQGAVSVDGIVRTAGSTYIGEGAEQFEEDAELTNAKTIVVVEGDPYAQIAVVNPTPTSSTDVIVYADNGNDSAGWIDVGVTGSEFEQAEFGITGPNDGYVFFEAPENTNGAGNLVIATGDKGTDNKIIIAAGGFATGTEQITITPDENVHIEIATESVSPTTGALTVVGGVGITGDVNIAGSITFAGTGTEVSTVNLAVTDSSVLVGSGSLSSSNDLSFITEGKYLVDAIPTRTVTNKVLTDNVATITTDGVHLFEEGDDVVVQGVDAVFDGTYTITDIPQNNKFSYAKTNANIPSGSASGTADVLEPVRTRWSTVSKRATNGTWNFVSNLQEKPNPNVDYLQSGIVYDTIRVGGIVNTGTQSITGSATVGGILQVVGNIFTYGALSASGNFSINNNKFTIDSLTGNTETLGTLDTAGNFKVNTDKFVVTALTGQVSVAGTITAPNISLTASVVNADDATTKNYVDRKDGVWLSASSNYTAITGDSIFSNTSSGAFTVTLPATPSVGDFVIAHDLAGTWNDFNLTLGRNGEKIMGSDTDFICNLNNRVVHLVYSGSEFGWRLV